MQITLISVSSLLLIISILIIIGIVEVQIHLKSLLKIPVRIHVNGTRGKSSVVRLIASGLRAGGLKTFAKTTGTIPRIINSDGNDITLHRLRSASIGEQIKLIRYFAKQIPDVIVMECMAVNPQYQWISEHRIIRSTLSVITNVRNDHVDEMGKSYEQIAYSLSNTIPFKSKLITSENKWIKPFKKISKERDTSLVLANANEVNSRYMEKFPFIEHPENISLALKVCNELGVEQKTALDGMLKTKPDPGALLVLKIKNNNKFVSAFAANDPDSTLKVWNLIKNRFNSKVCFFLNTREDRRYRTIQLINLVNKKIKPEIFIIRGNNIKQLINKNNSNTDIKLFNMRAKQDEIIDYITALKGFTIVGIGNIVGWGDVFIEKIKKI